MLSSFCPILLGLIISIGGGVWSTQQQLNMLLVESQRMDNLWKRLDKALSEGHSSGQGEMLMLTASRSSERNYHYEESSTIPEGLEFRLGYTKFISWWW